ncbi:S-adenosyl-L-methionine-dependent methyltransferase [Radiomyces spectabilis]|uniref:S-adenosyl-L-methionine-dependent methyltransferase n=1 Tax=Radiomyces spectabilis TaxID=64574 RepID=UPI00221ECAE4|nr:S-adenosyl-L-methionine-dependent methyltransferase [Radiomyces spectabilis]KAI8391170.1 S-adenosyl-L-methionine-dependent methyltransferase [Radiomyces spectabilis]
MSKPQPIAVQAPTQNEATYEQQNVHEVYEAIASHFSDTRYKPWPVVENFLHGLAPGSLGADVGCGNGKYIGVNRNAVILGSDRSSNLIKIVRDRGFEGMVADGLDLPYRSHLFDFAISIAVIHHFSTPERRLEALKELVRIVRPGGRILVFVWALEQTKFSKRNFEPGEQDVFVPWMLTKKKTSEDNQDEPPRVYNRYYHLFRKGELDILFEQIPGITIESSGYDRDNHYVIAKTSST